jgi:hypothetical protein
MIGLMEIDFLDIRIVSLEDEMTVESPNQPSLRYVYLKLSQTPPPLWQNYFKESRKMARHPHWRNAWIDRKFVVIECKFEEIETYHLNDLKQDLAQANRQYRRYLEQQSQTEQGKKTAYIQEVEKLREIKNRLNFD